MSFQSFRRQHASMTEPSVKEKQFTKPPLSGRKIAYLLLFLDLFGISVSFNLSHFLVQEKFSLRSVWFVDNFWIGFIILTMFYVFDLYKPDTQLEGMRAPVRSIVATAFSSAIVMLVMHLNIFPSQYSVFDVRFFLVCALPMTAVFSATSRFYVSQWVSHRTRRMRWLVIADLECSRYFWEEYSLHYNIGEADIVFLIDHPGLIEEWNFSSCEIAGWDEIDNKLKEQWTGIVIAKGTKVLSGSLTEKLMLARLSGNRIYDLTDFYEKFWFKVPVFYLKTGWFAMAHGFDLLHNFIGWRLKRLSDIFLALMLMTVSLPLMMIFAVLIHLESRGGAVYKQPRVGLNERIFTLYKFRTMYQNTDSKGIYTSENDKRVTRVGRFLRKMRLDELPQIFNVIKGDMSLIGPRAEWTECVKRYENVIPFYHLRHLVKPGITGWAQVYYPYGDSVDDAKEKLQYDLYYIKNYSFFLDIAIIFKTVRIVLFGKGR